AVKIWLSLATLLFLPSAWQASGGHAPEARQKSDSKSQGKIAVWDTGQASSEPLSAATLTAKDGWLTIPTQETAVSLKGDAARANGRILAVVRKGGSAVEVYSEGLGQPVARLRLVLLTPGGEPTARLDRVNLVENSRSGACVELHRQTTEGAAVSAKFRIK